MSPLKVDLVFISQTLTVSSRTNPVENFIVKADVSVEESLIIETNVTMIDENIELNSGGRGRMVYREGLSNHGSGFNLKYEVPDSLLDGVSDDLEEGMATTENQQTLIETYNPETILLTL